MKAKTIKAVLRKQINTWAMTIEDEAVRALVLDNAIVTGGAIASMLLNEPVNDFDIYFRTYRSALAVALYYTKRFTIEKQSGIPCAITVTDGFGAELTSVPTTDVPGSAADRIKIQVKSSGIASEAGAERPYDYFEMKRTGAGEYVGEIMSDPIAIEDAHEEAREASRATEDDGKPPFRPIFMSTNAITLSHRVQIVLRFHGEPDEIHKNYDFQHCTNYWTSWDGELVLRPEALESLLTRELRYVGSRYPICSLIRLRKFIKRGWTINAGQVLKMAMQVSELDLHEPAVLEDQLTGVDVAYFIELIEKVKANDPNKVNSAYLIEIIDRMF